VHVIMVDSDADEVEAGLRHRSGEEH